MGAGEEVEHRLGKDVGSRMADDEPPLLGRSRDHLEGTAVIDGPRQVELLAVHLHDHGSLGEAGTDAFGHL